ncbi:ATP-binding protein [Streptomyces sp. NPDC090499]|uniref:ATP-binding protein n=1 Tax=Streptomyces sp. NPDC090499 TaxID=3365965 RepID=UPI00380E9244
MPAAAASVRQARRIARAWCRYCRVPEGLIDSVLLIVSEMCANAILHGRSDSIGVRAWLPSFGVLRIEVTDYTPSQPPAVQAPSADSENGRGLFLVDAVAADAGGNWGFTADGTRAWCTLPLPTKASYQRPAAPEPDHSFSARGSQASTRDPASFHAHP